MRKIGYWSNDLNPSLPDPRDYIDNTWDMGERIKVIRYLRECDLFALDNQELRCRLGCTNTFGFSNVERTDGEFAWPESYAHYIETHGVKPPEDFLENIRNNVYKKPLPRKNSSHPSKR